MKIKIPDYVNKIITALEENGFEAYIVGGCVRDTLLMLTPHDFDVTTNALPEQMKQCFTSFKVVETGIKHGTLTVFVDSEPVEVTTYRIDGEYTDHRRPEEVTFTTSLKEDLARRDFTINALAYSEKTGIVDFFGGQDDLTNQVIRCVGEPKKRFSEDALRIMRALRFSATLGFGIESETSKQLLALKTTLKKIAVERISVELEKMIMGNNCYSVLMEYPTVLAEIIPEIAPCVGFEQHNKYHKYNVWEHIVMAVATSKKDRIIRLAMLLHDIEKPNCFKLENGQGHFYKHEKKSADKANEILHRLRYDNDTITRVCLLIENHYFTPVNEEKAIKKLLSKIGNEAFFQLLDVQRADANAKNDFCLDRLPILWEIEKSARGIISRGDCLSLKDLAVNGNDLMELGYEGKKIGETLKSLLVMVIDGKVANERDALLKELI